MKAHVSVIFAAVLFAVQPAAAKDVMVPNLVGMKGGNDIIAILTSLKLTWTFGEQQLPPKKELEFTVAAQSPAAGKSVPEGSPVAVVAFGRWAPFVVGLTLDKAADKLAKAGLHPGVTVVPAPSPDVENIVAYEGIPDESGNVPLKVYSPYSGLGDGTQESAATPPSGEPLRVEAESFLSAAAALVAESSSRPASILRAH
jgi:hypothetical protein